MNHWWQISLIVEFWTTNNPKIGDIVDWNIHFWDRQAFNDTSKKIYSTVMFQWFSYFRSWNFWLGNFLLYELVITCQPPIWNSESTNFFSWFFCFVFIRGCKVLYHYFTVYLNLIFLPRRKKNEMVKTFVNSEFMIGDWHVMNQIVILHSHFF